MEEMILLSNIHRLSKRLKIKIHPEIRGIDYYEALLFEIKASKFSISNGPNLLDIATILTAGVALLISGLLFYTNFMSDTVYYFSDKKEYYEEQVEAVDISSIKYLVKLPYEKSFLTYIEGIYVFIIIFIMIVAGLLCAQASHIKKMKKYGILEQFLERYLELRKKETN